MSTAPDARQAALRELDAYARSNVQHSLRQYDKHGTLHDRARDALTERDVWDRPWVPDDFDVETDAELLAAEANAMWDLGGSLTDLDPLAKDEDNDEQQ